MEISGSCLFYLSCLMFLVQQTVLQVCFNTWIYVCFRSFSSKNKRSYIIFFFDLALFIWSLKQFMFRSTLCAYGPQWIEVLTINTIIYLFYCFVSRLEELNVIDVQFLHGCLVPTIVFVHQVSIIWPRVLNSPPLALRGKILKIWHLPSLFQHIVTSINATP